MTETKFDVVVEGTEERISNSELVDIVCGKEPVLTTPPGRKGAKSKDLTGKRRRNR